jgi:hypothetical protein
MNVIRLAAASGAAIPDSLAGHDNGSSQQQPLSWQVMLMPAPGSRPSRSARLVARVT